MRSVVVLSALLLLSPSAWARTMLYSPTIFWVSSSGVDAGTACAQGAPCLTLQYAANMVEANYDLANQQVTFDACGLGDAVYPSGLTLTGPEDFVGHSAGPSQIVVRGDPANPLGCVIRPTSGYCFGANFGAQYEIEGFKCDASASGSDEVSVGQGARIVIDGFVFGDAYNPQNDLTVVGGSVDFIAAYSAEKTLVQTKASFSAGATTIKVDSSAGIVTGMVPTGSGFPLQVDVATISGNAVTLSRPTTAAESESPVYFIAGGQSHFDVANGGIVLFDTNCGQAPFAVSMGWAGYYDSMFHVAELGSVDLGATWSGNVAGLTASVHSNGVLDSCGVLLGQGVISDTGGIVK